MGQREFAERPTHEFDGSHGQFLSQRPQPAPGPALPATNVCSDADQVHTLLIKPAHTLNAALLHPPGDLQPRGSKQIAQEVKPRLR